MKVNYKIISWTIKNLRFLVVMLAMFVTGQRVVAQFDTEFYMPPVWEPGRDNYREPIDLQISTAFPIANVNIRTPDGITINDNITIGAGTSILYPLDINEGMTDVINTPELSKGLIITSDFPVQVSYRIGARYNQVFVTLKGARAIGTDFYAGSQSRNRADPNRNSSKNPHQEHHFISVMAMEDNTTVTINLPAVYPWDFVGVASNTTTFTLNRHETYLVRTQIQNEYVVGSHITSDKPIAVVSGSQHTGVENAGAREGGIDQLVPVELVGDEYILMRGRGSAFHEYAVMVATVDNTEIFTDGGTTPIATLNAGEVFTYQLPSLVLATPHYFRSTAPIYMYQVSGTNGAEVGMAIIPPLVCAGSKYIEFIKLTAGVRQRLNVVIPVSGLNSFEFNGVPFSSLGATATPAPGRPDFVSFPIGDDDLENRNVLTSDEFFQVGFLAGRGGTGTYGFLSGFGANVDILDPETLLPTTIYFVDSLFQGETGTACLLPESCAPPHRVTEILNSVNTGGTEISPALAPYDTCISYTASNLYTGRDTVDVTVENLFGFEGRVKLVWHVLSALDLRINAGSIAINPPLCPATGFDVSFDIQNVSNSTVFDGALSVSFYNGNPELPGAVFLGDANYTIGLLAPGEVFSVNNEAVTGDGSAFDLYIVINDDGSGGLPLSLPTTDVLETNYANNIGSSPVSPLPFNITAEKLKDNEKCDDALPDNGSARAAALVGGSEVTAGYTFHWLRSGTEVFSGAVYNSMAEGTYQVFAINNIAGCSSDTLDVTIGRISDDLVVTINQISPQNNCGNPNGVLEASVDGETTGFQFTWYPSAASIGDPAEVIGVGPMLENLRADTYFVLARETFSGCVGTNSQAVDDETVIPAINLLGLNDVTTCDPLNGSVSVNANGQTEGYTFRWTNEDGDTVGSDAELLNVGPGDYTVVATNDATGCESPSATFTVSDLTPPITFLINDDDRGVCIYNTVIATASATGGTSGFTYAWYVGAEPVSEDRRLGDGGVVEDLTPGTYTVIATNLANGCTGSHTFFLSPLDFAPDLIVTNVSDQTACIPPNGQIIVDVLVPDLNGVPQQQDPADYNFFLFEGENAGLLSNADFTEEGNNVFAGLQSGVYSIIVQQNFGDFCVSIPFSETVDFDGQAPEAALQITDPANCLFEDGSIQATDLQGLSDVSYAWYEGDSTQLEGALALPETSNVLSNLDSGYYTVIITNNSTQCTDTASVELVGKFTGPVELSTSSQPVDICYYNNGALASFVNVDPPTPVPNWEFTWFDASNTPVSNNPILDSVAMGTYRVQVRDVDDNVVCATDEVTVEDIREYPQFTITKDADLTICDPDRPDGQLSILLLDNGLVQDHTFEWAIKDDPDTELFGPIISGLTDTTYQAVVTNIFTGCASTGEESVDENQILPVVDPEVLAGRTDCLDPNGAARASVQGDTTNYDFFWYVSSTVGELVLEESYGNALDSGLHVVQAIDKVTACASAPEALVIPDLLVFPEFSIIPENATCDLPNGSARIVVENTFAQQQVIWNSVDFASTQFFGTELINAFQGEYEATVTTLFNCSTTVPAVIGEDINIFNLVTANNDGENDIFIIDCIENFENNIVRVYNRYGTLVYEDEGYDNVTVFFDGVGNNGTYAGGNQLPVGTYFYIVDKRDGSEPQQGFLELLR